MKTQKSLPKRPKGHTGQRVTASDAQRQQTSRGPDALSRWHALAPLPSNSGKNRDSRRRKCVPSAWLAWHALRLPPATRRLSPASVFVKMRRTKSTPCRGGGETDAALLANKGAQAGVQVRACGWCPLASGCPGGGAPGGARATGRPPPRSIAKARFSPGLIRGGGSATSAEKWQTPPPQSSGRAAAGLVVPTTVENRKTSS